MICGLQQVMGTFKGLWPSLAACAAKHFNFAHNNNDDVTLFI